MKTCPWLGLLLAGAAQAGPPALRDPMQPPNAVRVVPAPAPAAPPAPPPAVRQLLIIGDQRWVIEGGRRRGVGDLLGTARIERIEDSAVFVRQGGALLRLPLFAGVAKRPAAPASAPHPSPSTAWAGAPAAERPPR